MTSHRPKVSIGLPVYNGERYLAQTLDSILAQTFEDFELIISDNASTDGTAEICREYVARDGRIRYYRNETNLGVAANYNRLFALSAGEYFKWIAADDLCAPSFLERCVEALDRRPTAALACPKVIAIDQDGKAFADCDQLRYVDWRPSAVGRFRQFVDEAVWDSILIFGLVRSSALRQTRLLGKFVGGGGVFLGELILTGEVIQIPEYLSYIRLHPRCTSWRPWTPEQKSRMWDPDCSGPVSMLLARRRRYFEWFVAVARSPLGFRDKVSLFAYNLGRAIKHLGEVPSMVSEEVRWALR